MLQAVGGGGGLGGARGTGGLGSDMPPGLQAALRGSMGVKQLKARFVVSGIR